MSDFATEFSPPQEEIRPYMDTAKRIADEVDKYVRQTPINDEVIGGQSMKVDQLRPDVRSSVPSRFQGQGFMFWGGIDNVFKWATPGEPAANIKDIRIPVELRGRGIGKGLVNVWERAVLAEGITDLVVTNIKDERALRFWLSQGYEIPADQVGKAIPYCVVKKFT